MMMMLKSFSHNEFYTFSLCAFEFVLELNMTNKKREKVQTQNKIIKIIYLNFIHYLLIKNVNLQTKKIIAFMITIKKKSINQQQIKTYNLLLFLLICIYSVYSMSIKCCVIFQE